ncbi:hypothetical protein CGMCC3_g2841 [Colletotrichum fructicola]|nr:uncharacterized protein CGMCC3_g2841 [Colletotrichum fructicola]KAE9581243.1 hypothetical protein CGMCC3_g2841 [Colletotrichum fructicola]
MAKVRVQSHHTSPGQAAGSGVSIGTTRLLLVNATILEVFWFYE